MKTIRFIKQSAVVLMIVAVTCTGCGGGIKSPSSTVKEAFDAFIQKDIDTHLKYVYNPSGDTQMQARFLCDKGHIFKFEIQNERIFDNGEKAEVITKFFYKEDGESNEKISTRQLPLVKTASGWMLSDDYWK